MGVKPAATLEVELLKVGVVSEAELLEDSVLAFFSDSESTFFSGIDNYCLNPFKSLGEGCTGISLLKSSAEILKYLMQSLTSG